MRRITRGFLWLIKSSLLAIALAALVLSFSSFWQWGWIRFSRHTVEPARVEEKQFGARYMDGWISVEQSHRTLTGDLMSYGRNRAAANGVGWQWKGEMRTSEFIPPIWQHAWGPFRWSSTGGQSLNDSGSGYFFSVPCWLVALSAGIWPIISLLRWSRVAMQRRRLRCAGLCVQCGYDLRATPDRCPECGTVPHSG